MVSLINGCLVESWQSCAGIMLSWRLVCTVQQNLRIGKLQLRATSLSGAEWAEKVEIEVRRYVGICRVRVWVPNKNVRCGAQLVSCSVVSFCFVQLSRYM